MAYVEQPDQTQGQQAPGAQAIQPPTTSSSPGTGAGAAGSKNAPQATAAQPFQNLQSYLTANAPQVSQQANQIAGNLNNQYGQVQNDISQAGQTFGNQVTSGYAQPNSDLTNQAATNPTAVAGNPQNLAAFQSLYNDTYTGPSSFETSQPYTALNTEVTGAADNATNFNSLPGMQTYFQGQNPNATQGGNTLDAVLLSGNPEAYSQVQQAAQPFSNLPSYLSNAVTTADQSIAAANQAAQAEAKNLQNEFTGPGGVVPTFQKGVQSELTNDVGQTNAYNTALNQLINQEGSTPAITNLQNDIGTFNTNLAAAKNNPIIPTYDIGDKPVTMGNFTNPALMAQPTLGEAATPQDIATQTALQALLGSAYTNPIDTTNVTPFQSPTAPTLAGEASPVLSNLIPQVQSLNDTNPDVVALQKDIDSLQSYLGMTPTIVPGGQPTTQPVIGISPPGVQPTSQPVIGSPGSTYTDPATGQTKKAF